MGVCTFCEILWQLCEADASERCKPRQEKEHHNRLGQGSKRIDLQQGPKIRLLSLSHTLLHLPGNHASCSVILLHLCKISQNACMQFLQPQM